MRGRRQFDPESSSPRSSRFSALSASISLLLQFSAPSASICRGSYITSVMSALARRVMRRRNQAQASENTRIAAAPIQSPPRSSTGKSSIVPSEATMPAATKP